MGIIGGITTGEIITGSGKLNGLTWWKRMVGEFQPPVCKPIALARVHVITATCSIPVSKVSASCKVRARVIRTVGSILSYLHRAWNAPYVPRSMIESPGYLDTSNSSKDSPLKVLLGPAGLVRSIDSSIQNEGAEARKRRSYPHGYKGGTPAVNVSNSIHLHPPLIDRHPVPLSHTHTDYNTSERLEIRTRIVIKLTMVGAYSFVRDFCFVCCARMGDKGDSLYNGICIMTLGFMS